MAHFWCRRWSSFRCRLTFHNIWHGALLAHGVHVYPLIDARGALQLAALSCLTTAIAMYKFLLDPEVSVRTALFADQAI